MKNNILLYTIIAVLTGFFSCEDNRRQNLLPDKVYLVRKGMNVEESFDIGEKYVSQIWANKSGLNNTSCTVNFSVDPTALERYNNVTGSRFELLPASCYAITRQTFTIKGEEQYAKFQFEYDPAAIVEEWEKAHGMEPGFSKYGLTNYVLPVSIVSEGVDVMEDANTSFVRFAVNEPLISILTDHFDMVRVFEGETGVIEKTIEIGTSFENRWSAAVTLENDRAGLSEQVTAAKGEIKYTETRLKSKMPEDMEDFSNTLTHIEGVLPPDDAFVISGGLSLTSGVSKLTISVTVDKSKLYPGLNIIPVKLTGVTEPLKVSPGKNVCYIPVQFVPDRSGTPVKSSSSHQSADYSPKRIAGIFDGDFDTSWRPGVGSASFPGGIANDNNPAIVTDLGKETDVTAVEFWTRGPGERQGSRTETYRASPSYIRNVKIYVSSDSQCWEAANGEFLIQGTSLMTSAKSYWGESLVDYNWETDNPDSAPHTFRLPGNTIGRYVVIWYSKSANQADIWELFVYGKRE
ncbi:MAG: DUF1735 domain-containing protein [Tannerella sp.]|nr:DUF1735 domain-containing protein [Tannerella sp.]